MAFRGLAKLREREQARHQIDADRAPGWYSDDDGDDWFWTGQEWIDPIAEVESRISDLLIDHLTKVFRSGYERGAADAWDRVR